MRETVVVQMFGTQIRNITIPHSETSWTIEGLNPVTNYTCALTAVNTIGESEKSNSVFFQTEEEGNQKPVDISTMRSP